MRQLVRDVSERLGFNDPLQVSQVLAMHEMCRFDQAWNVDEPSPWCVVGTSVSFEKKNLFYHTSSNLPMLVTGIPATGIRCFRVS